MSECPKCKSPNILEGGRHIGFQLYHCGACKFQFTREAQALDDRIRTIRETLNLTQDELASHLSITAGTVAKWESGVTKIPRKLQLEQIENMERQIEQNVTVKVILAKHRRGPNFHLSK